MEVIQHLMASESTVRIQKLRFKEYKKSIQDIGEVGTLPIHPLTSMYVVWEWDGKVTNLKEMILL